MTSSKKLNATFVLGLPDKRTVQVEGYNRDGKLVYMWDGNADFHAQVTDDFLVKNIINIIWFAEPTRNFAIPHIIVNCINDADIAGESLKKAAKMISLIQSKKPNVKVFNDPTKVASTRRDLIYQNYHHFSHIEIPKTVRFTPSSTTDVLKEAEKQSIAFPFLIRPCGSHQSQGLQIIRSQSDVTKLEKYAFNGQGFYLTQFVDSANEKGLYKKCRLVIIGGKILPRHYMTGENWMVHGDLHQHYMATNEAAKKDELYFINNYKKMISGDALLTLRKIFDASGLDYLGFDFAIKPDKSLLIFEINPAQNSFLELDFDIFPYMKKVRKDIIKALNDSVMNKILK